MDRANLLESLYWLSRGAIGFSLIIGGAAILLSTEKDKASRCLATIFASVGFLFCISALGLAYRVPDALGSFIVIAAILAISQAQFELYLYLFGDEGRRRLVRPVLLAGIGWSILVWGLPFLDTLLGREATGSNVEIGLRLGIFHNAASIAVYAWPIAVSLIAVGTGHHSLRDIPIRKPGTGILVLSTLSLILVLGVILAGAALSSVALYRAGHAALELLTLSMYLFSVSRPDLFSLAGREIREARDRNLKLSEEESRFILERIGRVAASPSIPYRQGLDLRGLAAIVKVPPYRLSICFNACLKTSFPAWLNALRIERARRLIVEEPDRSVLEIATGVGYGSRAVFNSQFLRIVGMTPSEYRRTMPRKAQGPGRSPRESTFGAFVDFRGPGHRDRVSFVLEEVGCPQLPHGELDRGRRKTYPGLQVVLISVETGLGRNIFAAFMEIDVFLSDETGEAPASFRHASLLKW
jgi:AraC-like DNA-binding protein